MSVLLAMDSVLERERENRIRARLMEEAIESINSMGRDEFAAAVYEYQQELLTSALLAEEAEIARRQQFKNVPFKIVSGNRNIIFTQIKCVIKSNAHPNFKRLEIKYKHLLTVAVCHCAS